MSNGELPLEDWIFGLPGEQRFTQDSPVLPEVWRSYAEHPGKRQDLLLTPHKDSSAAKLRTAISNLAEGRAANEKTKLGYNEGYVVVSLDLHEMVRELIPLSPWWQRARPSGSLESWVKGVKSLEGLTPRSGNPAPREFRPDWLAWFLALVGRVELANKKPPAKADRFEQWRRYALAGAKVMKGSRQPEPGETPLWTVSINRVGRTTLSRSRLAVKADAAERVFAVDCRELRWAIIDTGVDASHPAFGRRGADGVLEAGGAESAATRSRVVATYDFFRLRQIISGRDGDLSPAEREEVEYRVGRGRAVDWDQLEPLLRVSHETDYPPPKHAHGTHVAGILGADWRTGDSKDMPAEQDLVGVCPNIELYDLRVFGPDGTAEEFAVLAALQFIRHLNSHSDLQVIHGANLSLAFEHDFANYAVGRTPICDECERLAASGVVVTVAAGNEGQAKYTGLGGKQKDGFRTVAITDPGNAENVITVGSTHRQNPHTYGVSYFSSRGPTGDGRVKPDLVAPGEKITSTVPGEGFEMKDGTSQAAPHVAGVAAMLMARNPELVAQPQRVKQILCSTATDLGRERYFQGAGMIDALRALQEV
ncbi:MAG TPA: S8 family peptidase [Solirubrobacterales bacterium]|nr:S8 family peptidase [Solirubrobacterales bacterium]